MGIKYTTILFLLLRCILTKGQFSDSLQYRAYFNSSGTFNRTNALSSYLFYDALNLSSHKKDVTCNLQTKWLYGKQNKVVTNNDYSSSLDINLYKTLPHFNYWKLFNYASSYSLKINSQLQTGLGVAYTFIDRKQLKLNVSDGFLYEFSSILKPNSFVEEYSTVRNSLRLRLSGSLHNRLSFSTLGFYQPSVIELSDYIIKSDINLSLKLRKWISINATFIYNRVSRTRGEIFFSYLWVYFRTLFLAATLKKKLNTLIF